MSYRDAVNAPLDEHAVEALRRRLQAPDAPRRTVRRKTEPAEHPHFVMDVDGEVREWSTDDMQRLQEAVSALQERLRAVGRLWTLSTTEEAT